MTDLKALMRTERLALVELLETLTGDEWATPSLCEGWTVQEVAAHLAWFPAMPPSRAGVEMARAQLRLHKMIHGTAVRDARRGVPAILDQLRRNAEHGTKPVGVPTAAPMSDAVIHQLDIRRPLGKPRAIPPEAFAAAASFYAATVFPATLIVGNVRKRIAGLRLVANDVDWSYGEGSEVRGSSESLMLMLAGRAIGPEELTGPGAADLYARLQRSAAPSAQPRRNSRPGE